LDLALLRRDETDGLAVRDVHQRRARNHACRGVEVPGERVTRRSEVLSGDGEVDFHAGVHLCRRDLRDLRERVAQPGGPHLFEGFGIDVSGVRVQGSGFRVQGSGFIVLGLGFWVQGLGLSRFYCFLFRVKCLVLSV